MHTLSDLTAGKLNGITRLTLSENLTSFPLEILTLADSLEILDLSNNQLTDLPNELVQLKKLKILFASENQFTKLPEVLGECENLEMVGFKSNQIKSVPPSSLPKKLRWLILTNNEVESLPNELGLRPRLKKLALAGNRLTELPSTLNRCHNLELIRISANQLTTFPQQLLDLPKLAWLAFAGNPFCQLTAADTPSTAKDEEIPKIASTDFTLKEVLGQGASGVISKAHWNTEQSRFTQDIAVKVFKGEITSDGYPKDELAVCLKAGKHINLVQPLAQVQENDCLALVMSLIPPHYKNLGLPPNFDTCTRDTFTKSFSLSIEQIAKIVKQMESVFEHLHNKKICHGDLYAHNTLFDDEANIIFGDFGAASLYHMLTAEQQNSVQAIEQRALNYFIEDLLSICKEEDKRSELFLSLSTRIKF
ncbi:leucine-rich repeat-containing serine/threonine-protein kinase [Marinomonas sp. C2222]|uniref:Leucine-rich repeat-containing serine/threonine-protein kinase n=1 Tax=Marinomonas sargassi TaxID=2984494 RepID=A0ABT2YU22_9GAMM|nr:leucine-rich repeat-containing protein kinase family protein [Marinomonas sargassi]MCV2403392.1 leucine-rich repeat-containing serine/threonine-protein kinase [Marinomonas sargassi]